MRDNYIILIFTLLIFSALSGKSQDFDFDEKTSQTYALIIGVSDYSDEKIPQLNFAHKDAVAFEEYLKSPAGGAVPKENIQLLTNEKATIGAIDDGIYRLENQVKEGDYVIIFFSGHGDVEQKILTQKGYLLAHNTPFTNYPRHALALEKLDELVVGLAAIKNVKTLIVLDACRAGNLAGSAFNGANFTAEQAANREANELRILSCKSDQQSWENPALGGGRGVFSYYFINGLKGLADLDDGEVSKTELELYTSSRVKKQALSLSENKKRQEPKFVGDGFVLAKVDPETLAAVKAEQELTATDGSVAAKDKGIKRDREEEEENAMEILIEKITSNDFLDGINYSKVLENDSADLVSVFLDKYYAENQEEVDNLEKTEELITETTVEETIKEEVHNYFAFPIPNDSRAPKVKRDTTFVTIFEKLSADSITRSELGRKLAIKLHDRGQEIVNQYLTGDTLELKRRKYYSERKGDYDNYADMFKVAMDLLPDDHPSHDKLEIKHHYFKGVAARINMPTTKNRDSLLRIADFHQSKAFELDSQTAYIANEMANIAALKGNQEDAIKYYNRASDLAPVWAIPYSNMATIYYNAGKMEEAKNAAETAKKYGADLSAPYNNLGRIYFKQKDYLHAEENYRRSTEKDNKSWIPFEGLGHVYLQNTDYALADSFYNQADIRKKGLYFETPESFTDTWLEGTNAILFDTLNYDVSWKDKTVLAEFARGINAYGLGKFDEAEKRFREVVLREPNHPLAFYFLGKMFFEQNRFEEAEIMLNYGLENHFSKTIFEKFIANLQSQIDKNPNKYSVGTEVYTDSYFDKSALQYLLADLYKSWKRYAAAEEVYLGMKSENSGDKRVWEELWTLYEFLQRYNEAESTILGYVALEKASTFQLLDAFYSRVNKKLPSEPNWFYKKGLLQIEEYKHIFAETGEVQNFDIISPNSPYFYVYSPEEPLLKTLEIAPDFPSVVDIYLKLGELELMRNRPDNATVYFEKAVLMEPTHADPRLEIVEAYNERFRFQEALGHLDFLRDSSHVNYRNRLRYADYMIRTSKFEEAKSLLLQSEDFDVIANLDRINLYAKMNLNSGKPKKAIDFYTKKLSFAGSPSAVEDQYSIARAKMDLGKKTEALDDLKNLLATGNFDYPFVLRFDEKWDALRESADWKELIDQYFE